MPASAGRRSCPPTSPRGCSPAEDLLAEEERGLHLRFGGGGGGRRPRRYAVFAGADDEPERFSDDRDWMPRLVLIAKTTYVWLDQLSRRYGRDIRTLDAIPDEELDRLARRGVTGLWLIGLWQRSRASRADQALARQPRRGRSRLLARRLPHRRRPGRRGGLREPARAGLGRAASGWRATWSRTTWASTRAGSSTTRSGSCRSPSRRSRPTRSAARTSPTTTGSEIRLEDHYWNDCDAAVSFERRDRATGERRYVYHGNDGTSFPWNDTAQLDYLQAEVREAVIQTILAVARRFPVIRFDAAMVLAKKHIAAAVVPGAGPRRRHPVARASTRCRQAGVRRARCPHEFWREVVDRVAAEAPDTLLLAEAFWLMEGYFVRTLGHAPRLQQRVHAHAPRRGQRGLPARHQGHARVRPGDPQAVRELHDEPRREDRDRAVRQRRQVLRRRDADRDDAGPADDRPRPDRGLQPRSTGWSSAGRACDEAPNEGLVAPARARLAPLLHGAVVRRGARLPAVRRARPTAAASVDDVFAYSNGRGAEPVAGRLPQQVRRHGGLDPGLDGVRGKDGDGSKRSAATLASALGLPGDDGAFVAFREARSGLEYLRSGREVHDRGLFFALDAYGTMVFG